MTATLHVLGDGRDAGLYYVNDPNREARPRNRDEYYLSDGGGIWWSTGSSIVTHGAAINRDSFRDLCAGLHPRSGKGIVRGSGEKHRAGWDVTFSAPKSLSLLWAAGDERQRSDIERLHGVAVEAALSFVERRGLLEVRLGAGGTIRERPMDVIFGLFRHTTSRAGDPNLHTHCVLLNVAGCVDSRWRTLEPDAMFKWVKTVGAAYRAQVSQLMAERGFAFREAGRDQIEILGIDEELIETFSKRSRMIEELVGDRATASGARKELAALSTRQSKETLPTGAELEARWMEEFGSDRGRIWEQALRSGREHSVAIAQSGYGPQIGGNRALSDAVAHDDPKLDPVPVAGDGPVARGASALLAHQSVIDRRELMRQALIEASRVGIGIAEVEAELERLEKDGLLLALQPGRSAAWTTEHLMEREAAMLVACRRADERSFFRRESVRQALAALEHLSEEQRAAVEGATSRGGLSLIEAGAGTGKTTLAAAIRDAADRSGLKVVGLAPTWLAADELSRSIGVPAQAVAKWRYDREKTGRVTRNGARELPRLDSKTVLLLDEAGMLGTLDMAAVLTAAKAAGSKVIAFGDRRQLMAVSQGNPLALVAEELRQVETLTTIRRQRHSWQRDASLAMSEGRFDGALAAYHREGQVQFAKDQVTALRETIRHWSELRKTHTDDVVVVTRSNRDAVLLNGLARNALRDAGELDPENIIVPSIDRKNKAAALALASGDRIRFGANLQALGIRNGTRGTVTAIEPAEDADNPIVHVALENGASVTERWQDFAPPPRGTSKRPLPRITHAYAGTVYSVQGRTAEAAVFHIGSRTDSREAYVAMTRHREALRVVVDADRLLREASHTVLEPSAPVSDKLAALVVEAERYDEKLNIASFRQRYMAQGWMSNGETFTVFKSWTPNVEYVDEEDRSFAMYWADRAERIRTYDVPTAVRLDLLRFLPPDDQLPARLQQTPKAEPEPIILTEPIGLTVPPRDWDQERADVWQRVRTAARDANGGIWMGEATSPVEAWPHQRRAFLRMYGEVPDHAPRLLIADEVGLGKTVQAGLLMRQGWLAGRLRRAIILAPKNVCTQWQAELREKFALDWPIYDGKSFRRYDAATQSIVDTPVTRDAWSAEPFVIMSSHLARRSDRGPELLEAEPYDVVVVDEAHHARQKRTGGRVTPKMLMRLLRDLRHRTHGLILLSATPLQTHAMELYDLLSLLGLPPEWDAVAYERYFAALADPHLPIEKMEESARLFRVTEAFFGPLPSERAARMGGIGGQQLSTIRTRRIIGALRGAASIPRRQLSGEDRAAAVRIMKRWTPVAALMSRHTRSLLRRYQAEGKLQARIAVRNVQDRFIHMEPAERNIYERVESFIRSAYQNADQSQRTAIGFVLTIYRKRLSSSFAALAHSLQGRLDRQVDDDQFDLEEGGEEVETDEVKEKEEIARRLLESAAIRDILADLQRLPIDTKARALKDELTRLAAEGYQQTMVFTGYTDTMDGLRDWLADQTGREVICFSGRGGEIRTPDGSWRLVSRSDIKKRFREGKGDILLCTDAAAEGLNFQFCGSLINYDMPWNPMRVEQRIGRIDRLGQRFDSIRIANLHYTDTVETEVYLALSSRIKLFEDMVGGLQPILSAISREIGSLALAGAHVDVDAMVASTIKSVDTPTVDIDDVDDWGDMPEMGLPALSLEDLKAIVNQPRLLPLGYELAALDVDDFTVEEPISRRRRRVTLSRSFYASHFGHTDFWTPGSLAFPIEGSPTSLSDLTTRHRTSSNSARQPYRGPFQGV